MAERSGVTRRSVGRAITRAGRRRSAGLGCGNSFSVVRNVNKKGELRGGGGGKTLG